MIKSRKPLFFHPAAAIVPGVIVAQIVGTIQVYLSNAELYAKVKAISNERFLAIPNQQITPRLLEIDTAICGGLFFALSIGAGISLLAFAAARIWYRISSSSPRLLLLFVLIWLGFLVFINLPGLSLLPSLYVFLIPPLVFIITVKSMPRLQRSSNLKNIMIHVMPIFILTGLWFTQYDRYLFLDLRDYLLLSSPIGKKISDFYYNYTLYSAEVFKSQNQKLLKTVHLQDSGNLRSNRNVEKILILHDYLPVHEAGQIDLSITGENDILSLFHRGRRILQTKTREFLSDPGTILNQFSQKCDRHANFRQITFISLLFGYPLLLYILAHAFIWILTSWLVDTRKAAILASILCFMISVAILVQFHMARKTSVGKMDIGRSLQSERWQTRVTALRAVCEKGLEIGKYPTNLDIAKSKNIPERYWLAKALAKSRKPETYGLLLSLLEDSNPNVVSMAFSALAQRRERRAVKEILKKIKESDNWYSQVYAYRALRALGWTQTRSH